MSQERTRHLLLIEIDDEVLLGLELPRELGGRDRGERALFRLDLWVGFH